MLKAWSLGTPVIDATLRELLRPGYETSDADYAAACNENMSRTVYFMASFLAEAGKYKYLNSIELQHRIDGQVWTVSPKRTKKSFNAVDWFSSQWNIAKQNKPTEVYFLHGYLELFDRNGEAPTSYRIKPELYEHVSAVLSELTTTIHSNATAPSKRAEPTTPSTSDRSNGEVTFTNINEPGDGDSGFASAEELGSEGFFDLKSLEDARDRTLRGNSETATQEQFGVDYREADEISARQDIDPFQVDPAVIERGVKGHAHTQNLLASTLKNLGISPRSPRPTEPNFDIAWEAEGKLFVAEVKSLTSQNEEKQLRLGLGQVLRYSQQIGGNRIAVPVLAVERPPSDLSWQSLCDRLGVLLTWPDLFLPHLSNPGGRSASCFSGRAGRAEGQP